MAENVDSIRPRLAWFSPTGSGAHGAAKETRSSYFSFALLPYLSKNFEIEMFCDHFDGHPNFPTFHFLRAADRHRERPFDAWVYQLEDERCSYFSRIHLALKPGIVVFHDFLLSDDGPEPIMNSAWKLLGERFRCDAAAWPDPAASHHQHRPEAVREATAAVVPLFTAVRDLEAYERARAAMLFHPLVPDDAAVRGAYLPWPVEVSAAARCVAPQRDYAVVALCASPRIEHRAHKLLQALAQVAQDGRCPAYVRWLVSDAGEVAQAQALLSEFSIQRADVRPGRCPTAWQELLRELDPYRDVVFHQSFSMFGQTGPYLQISLAQGFPCVVSDFGEMDHVPEGVVWKIPPGSHEALMTAQVLAHLLSPARSWIPDIARDFAREWYDARIVAHEMTLMLHRAIPRLEKFGCAWAAFEAAASSNLFERVREAMMSQPGVVCAQQPGLCASSGDTASVWNSADALYHWTHDEPLKELGWQ